MASACPLLVTLCLLFVYSTTLAASMTNSTLMVTLYTDVNCSTPFVSYNYTSNTNCYVVNQPPAPTIYLGVHSSKSNHSQLIAQFCSNCSTGAQCTGKFMSDTCYDVDKLINSTKYPFGVEFRKITISSTTSSSSS
jgi:hypothetical protein